MNTHRFASVREAYDESQCRDDIKDGDLLLVCDEENPDDVRAILILVGAWPTRLVGADEHRESHTPDVSRGFTWATLDGGKYLAAAQAGKQLWDLHGSPYTEIPGL